MGVGGGVEGAVEAKQMQNKSKKKTNRKSKINAKEMQMDKSIDSNVSPFLTCFPPFILLPVFFSFEVLLFDFPCVFPFLAFFSSLKIIRISY